jgi:hypothetical protein
LSLPDGDPNDLSDVEEENEYAPPAPRLVVSASVLDQLVAREAAAFEMVPSGLQQQQQQEEEEDDSEWACSACTLLNTGLVFTCGVCGAAKPAAAPTTAALDFPALAPARPALSFATLDALNRRGTEHKVAEEEEEDLDWEMVSDCPSRASGWDVVSRTSAAPRPLSYAAASTAVLVAPAAPPAPLLRPSSRPSAPSAAPKTNTSLDTSKLLSDRLSDEQVANKRDREVQLINRHRWDTRGKGKSQRYGPKGPGVSRQQRRKQAF